MDARSTHIPALARLFDAYRVFYQRSSDPAAALDFVSRQISSQATRFFVAEIAPGSLAGFVHLLPSISTLAMRPIWILEDLFVAPEFRRRGIAEGLMLHAEAFARETGAERMTLSTAHDNHTAQALYRKAGWVRDEHFWYFHRFLS